MKADCALTYLAVFLLLVLCLIMYIPLLSRSFFKNDNNLSNLQNMTVPIFESATKNPETVLVIPGLIKVQP
jgi:hypothetical protein